MLCLGENHLVEYDEANDGCLYGEHFIQRLYLVLQSVHLVPQNPHLTSLVLCRRLLHLTPQHHLLLGGGGGHEKPVEVVLLQSLLCLGQNQLEPHQGNQWGELQRKSWINH